MSFGRELKDFVAGFGAGWKLVDSARDTQYRAEARDKRLGIDRAKDKYVNDFVEKEERKSLPVSTETIKPQTVEQPDIKPVEAVPVEQPSFAGGGRAVAYNMDESRMPRRARYKPGVVPEDETAYEGGEDETFMPIGSAETVRDERPSAPAPVRVLRRGALPTYPEDVKRPTNIDITGPNPGRGREDRIMAAPDPAPAVGPADIVGINPGRGRPPESMPGRGRAPYIEPYSAGTGEGPYRGVPARQEPGYHAGTGEGPYYSPEREPIEPSHVGTGTGPYDNSEVPTEAIPTQAATKPAGKPGGGSGGARPQAAGRSGQARAKQGAVPTEPDTMLVSPEEIRANNMTPGQVTELNEARKAAQRMSISRGEDPNQNIQRRTLNVTLADGGNAVDSAVGFLSKVFGAGRTAGAVPTPADGAANSQAIRRWMSGEGAAPAAEVQAAERAVDPNGELSQARRVMLTLGATHRYYLEQGEPEKAKRAAASLLQYYQLNAGRLAAIAKVAYANGDVTGAVKAATAAYNTTPDGNELTAKVGPNGTVAYRVTDIASGKPVAQGQGPAGQLLAQALQNANPMSYLTQAAGVRAARAAGGGGGRKAAGAPAGGTALNEALNAVREAQAAYDANPDSSDAKARLDAAIAAYRKVPLAGKGSPEFALKSREDMLAKATGGGAASGAGGGGGSKGGGAGTAEERAAAKADAELKAINDTDDRLLRTLEGVKKDNTPAVDTSMPRSESTATEIARRSNKIPDAPIEEISKQRERFDDMRADISAGKSSFDMKSSDRNSLSKELNEVFGDLETGPLARATEVDPKTKERKLKGTIGQGDVDNLKRWAYATASANNMPVDTAAKVAVALADVDPANPSTAPNFAVQRDGTVRLANGMTVRLGSETLKDILLWRRRKIAEMRAEAEAKATKQNTAEAEKSAYWQPKKDALWGNNVPGRIYGDVIAPTGRAIGGAIAGAGRAINRVMPQNPGNLRPLDAYSLPDEETR